MATELVKASITKWKPGLLGTAVVDRTDTRGDAFDSVSDDQIKLRMFARWLQDELGHLGLAPEKEKERNELWQSLKDGFVTVDILERKTVTPPGVSTEKMLISLKSLLTP